jgi:carbonic anhydrase
MIACAGGTQMTTNSIQWSYSGAGAPERWGSLSEEFRPCSEGVEQSPVNITGYSAGDAPPIAFTSTGRAIAARNNGHTVYLDFEQGNVLDVGGQRYELQGVHHHSPGEHQVDGEIFAVELHLVHRDTDGNLSVVGLLFREGLPSPLVQHLLDVAPEVGATVTLADGATATEYIPQELGHFAYAGSLTTPPCTEGVRWIVMQTVGTVSQQQVDGLQGLTGGPNNRPVQGIGSRTISSVGG